MVGFASRLIVEALLGGGANDGIGASAILGGVDSRNEVEAAPLFLGSAELVRTVRIIRHTLAPRILLAV